MVDMSKYLVHFSNSYDSIMGILSSGTIDPSGPFGKINKLPQHREKTVCLSEKPFDALSKLSSRRGSKFGLAFTKEFIISKGGNRVWYVEKNSSQHVSLERMASSNNSSLLELVPFIEIVSNNQNERCDFDWEREWRVIGQIHFSLEDVKYLFIPSDSHQHARMFFDDAERENTGPNYQCPFIDPINLKRN
jgi:hypothetical protein